MAVKNKALRQDIVEESIFKVGRDFAKSLEPGVQATLLWKDALEQLKQVALEYANVEQQFKVSDSRKEFLKIKQEEERLRKLGAEALKKEQDALTSIQKTKQSLIDTEKKTIALAGQKERRQKSTIKLTEKERLEIRLLNRGRREAAVLSSKLSTEYEKQSVRLIQLRRKYKDVALVEGEASKNARRLQIQVNKLDQALKRVDANVGQFQRNVGNYSKAMRSAVAAARSLAGAIGLTSGAFLAVQVVRDAIKVIRDFEKQNATLSAILQVSKEDMKGLTDEAIRLGSETVKTASQVTQLQIAYARLGFSQQDIINLTEATISGSIAMNAELDKTANLVGAVINTFDDLETTDAAKVIDVLSLSTAKSALNFQKLETGIPIVAGAAEAANIPFTTLVALLGKLSDSGIDISTSATALRNIFIESAAEGLNYGEILEKIKNSQDKLTASNDAFGKRAAVSAAVLSKNIETTKELDEALQGAAGTAERMANKELDTLDGSLKLLRSAWEGFILGIDESTGAASDFKTVIDFLATNLKQIFSVLGLVTKTYLAYVIATKLARLQTSLVNIQLRATRTAALASAKGINRATLAFTKFSKVLKANALGIAITVVTGLILLYEKYNKTLEETVAKTNESTRAFLDSREEQEKNAASLTEMADRYDELSTRTDLNKEEQKELDDIVKEIAKSVPKAVIEIDKYGNALKVNTKEVEKFNKANGLISRQQEATLLRESRQELALLQKQQEQYNNIQKEGIGFIVRGVGTIANYNGKLREQVVVQRKSGDQIKAGNLLTTEQLKLVQDAIKLNETNIKEKQRLIKELTAEGRAQLENEENARKLAEANKKQAEEAKTLADQKADEILKVSDLKGKINALKKEQESLTKNDKVRAEEIKKLLKIYQDEINSILGVSAANKSAEKAEKERVAKLKKLAQDTFNLRKFFLNKEIDLLKETIKDETKTFDEREKAIRDKAKLEESIALETSKKKLNDIRSFSDEDLAILLSNGQASLDARKELSDAELLIIEEFQAKKKQIDEKSGGSLDSLSLEKLKSDAAVQKALKEKQLTEEIQRENELFRKEIAVTDNREKVIEDHERRVAEIKRKYALEALNVQVKAIETLLQSEELSAKQRADAEINLARIKRQISDLTVEKFLTNNEELVNNEKLTTEEILSISADLGDALNNLADTISGNKIQAIDDEIEANDRKYEKLLENDELSAQERKAIEERQERDRLALEEKKKKEQRKQAIFAKAFAALNIGLTTAQAIIAALAPPPIGLGPVAGIPLSITTGAIGAIQLAAVLAQKIPKYFKGTDNHPGGFAEVAEIRPEVVQEPNKAPYIVRDRSILDLPQGTKVTPSVEEYKRLFRASTLASLQVEDKKIQDHETRMAFNSHYNFSTGRIEEELSGMRSDIKRFANRPVIVKAKLVQEDNYSEY